MKTRLDKLLFDRGFAPSRERAHALIIAGKILVDEQKIEKPGAQVESDSLIRLLGEDLRYVSRGGLKLEKALEYWGIDVTGKTCIDVGASTGGFTDCLLQHGAAHVITMDVGHNQLDWKIRNDERVEVNEGVNARFLKPDSFKHRFDLATMDLSFISATKVMPA